MYSALILISTLILDAVGGSHPHFGAVIDSMIQLQTLGGNVSLWTEQAPSIQSIMMTQSHPHKAYDLAFGELWGDDSQIVGETFVVRKKSSGRSVNVNVMMSGDVFVFIQDPQDTESHGVTTKIWPKSAQRQFPDAEAAQQTLIELGRQRMATREPRVDWGWDVAIPEGEKDGDGLFVLDGLYILSKNAETAIFAMYGMSVDEFVAVNELMLMTAWHNSGIDEVRVRTVGIELWDQDIAVNVDNTFWVRDFTQSLANDLGADFVAYFSNGTQFGPGSASGLGFIEDPYALTLVDGITGWRHEIGHNAGNNHCWEEGNGFEYKHGWQLEELPGSPGTIMCGNSISVFSNPDLTVRGIVAGNTEKADATRQWHDAVAAFSGQREHILPFDDEKPTYVLKGVMTQNQATDNIVEWNVVENTNRIILKTFTPDPFDETSYHSVWMHSDCCPGVYYGQSLPQVAHVLIMPCPAVGDWMAYISGPGPTNYTIELYA